MATEDLEQMLQMHLMCSEELQQLQDNIQNFQQSSAKMLEIIHADWQDTDKNNSGHNAVALLAYDNFMTRLSNVMDLSRKFNLSLLVNNLEKNSSAVLFDALQARLPYFDGVKNNVREDIEVSNVFEVAKVIKPLKQNEKSQIQQKTIQENGTVIGELNLSYDYNKHSIPPIEEDEDDASTTFAALEQLLHITKKDLSVYQPGCVLNASVTYIQNIDTLRFFAFDVAGTEIKAIAELNCMRYLRQYTNIPPKNEIFGLVLENTLMRAVLLDEKAVDMSKSVNHVHQALLLDFGEKVEITAATDIMYHLPEEQKQIPAQAMPCQLLPKASSDPLDIEENSLKKQLEQLLYEKVNFYVVAVERNILHLQLNNQHSKIKTNPQIGSDNNAMKKLPIPTTTASSPTPILINTNPFRDAILLKTTTMENSLQTEPLVEPLPKQQLDSYVTKNTTNTNGFTPEEMEMLHEEPEICTSNAMKAVMGYDPTDDKRICRFYDPKIRACFKGTYCKLEHSLPQPEGWTKDVLPTSTILDNRQPTVRYTKGTIISITPTYVGQLEIFYAQINDPLADMIPLIWNPEDVPDSERLQKQPLTFSLVLAKYEDGLWYRAKVIEADTYSKMIKVFYVDYGNHQIVNFRDLARCDINIASLPFQAVLCRLAGVRDASETTDQRKLGVDMLCKFILNQTLNVKVVSHHEDLLVSFADQRFAHIPNLLVDMGCMKRFSAYSNNPKLK